MLYTIQGNATRAARLAGYMDGPGLRVTASRLLRNANICSQIGQERKSQSEQVRRKIGVDLYTAIHRGMTIGVCLPEAMRAARLLNKLGFLANQGSSRC